MPCFSPVPAWRPDSGGKLVFAERAGYSPLVIACGQCIGCRLERSRQWAVRCFHESQMHDASEFVTLTYDDDHVPVDYSLHYSDFQLFMKRLRKFFFKRRQAETATGAVKELSHDNTDDSRSDERCGARSANIRFYMCGEYGENTSRPHFHSCLFGVLFPDRKFFKETAAGGRIYTSEILSSLWGKGLCSTGDVTFESAAYIARYVLKKRFGDVANEFSHYRYVDDYGEVHYREPEFNSMSLKPGIGGDWFAKFSSDVYPRDAVLVRGVEAKPPKYYDTLLERRDYDMREYLSFERSEKAVRFLGDTTPARLRVREACSRARAGASVRGL